jgi:hypothetical protein
VIGAIIAAAITAPVYAIAVSVLFFDLAGGHLAAGEAPPTPPVPTPPAS